MSRWTASRILVSGAFLASVMIAANLTAQLAPRVPIGGGNPQKPANNRAPQTHNPAMERHPACQRILAECRNLGFIEGQWQKDNGLWKDCFDPVVKGGTPTRDGKPINVPVNQSDIQACRGAGSQRNATKPTKPTRPIH